MWAYWLVAHLYYWAYFIIMWISLLKMFTRNICLNRLLLEFQLFVSLIFIKKATPIYLKYLKNLTIQCKSNNKLHWRMLWTRKKSKHTSQECLRTNPIPSALNAERKANNGPIGLMPYSSVSTVLHSTKNLNGQSMSRASASTSGPKNNWKLSPWEETEGSKNSYLIMNSKIYLTRKSSKPEQLNTTESW